MQSWVRHLHMKTGWEIFHLKGQEHFGKFLGRPVVRTPCFLCRVCAQIKQTNNNKSTRTFKSLIIQNAKPSSRMARLIYIPPEEYENALSLYSCQGWVLFVKNGSQFERQKNTTSLFCLNLPFLAAGETLSAGPPGQGWQLTCFLTWGSPETCLCLLSLLLMDSWPYFLKLKWNPPNIKLTI